MDASYQKTIFTSSGKEQDYAAVFLKRFLPCFFSSLSVKKKAVLAAIFFALLSSFALFLRFYANQPLVLGDTIYRQAGFVKHFFPYGILLSRFYLSIAPFFGILLGTVTLYLLGILFERLSLDRNIQTWTLLALLLTPAVLYSFTTIHYTAVLLFFFVLLFFTCLHGPLHIIGKDITKPFLLLNLFFALLIDSVAVFLFLLFLLIYWKYGQYKSKYADSLKECSIMGFVLLILFVLLQYLFQGSKYLDQLFSAHGLLQMQGVYYYLLADFGGLFGFSLFLLLLASIGMLKLWHQKHEYLPFFFVLCFTLAGYLFLDATYSVFLVLILALTAALGFNALLHQTWKLSLIKDFCLLLLVLGCVFTATAFIFRYPLLAPQAEFLQGLELLTQKYHADEESLLTYERYEPYLASLTDFSLVTDPLLTQPIFTSRRLDTLLPLLDNSRIRYIVITPEMKSGLVWNETTQLLFLLENSEKFKKKIENSQVEIWIYKGNY